uniref:BAR domain-containing protein n=1 Tax=Steinernema glaseri TaxID=37863 RepID=A0A1I7Z821_9BILA
MTTRRPNSRAFPLAVDLYTLPRWLRRATWAAAASQEGQTARSSRGGRRGTSDVRLRDFESPRGSRENSIFDSTPAMDFNFKKLANDATGFFNRAKQYTEETFLKAEKTELDANFENLLQRADKTEEHTKRLLATLESYLQPNPTVRMEEVFYEKLELKKEGGRTSNLEHLGQAMTDAGNEFGSGTPYGNALLKVANAQFKLGTCEREFINASAANTLLPIRRFLEGDMKTIQKERKTLHSKRLDLDAAKNRLKKAKTLETQASSQPNIGLTIEQAEADLRVAQTEFDKQVEITKLLLEGIQTAHNNQMKCLRDFVEAQMSFFASAHQHLADLQRELSGDSL